MDDAKLPTRAEIDEALARAADESFLAADYRPIVRPLLRIPRDRWPTCCGGGCEPCSTTLVRVADRTLEILGRSDPLPDDESA